MITFCREISTFYLETQNTSYIIRILDNDIVIHSYYGSKITREDISVCDPFGFINFSTVVPDLDPKISPESLRLEYPTFGRGDFRTPAVSVLGIDGTFVNDLRYRSYRILSGKPHMSDMPQMDVNTDELQTLELILEDCISGFEVVLYYTPLDYADVIARRAVIRNQSDETIILRNACSASLDICNIADYDCITLQGSWARERYVERYPLHHGCNTIESRRCASSHELNPFAALAEKSTTEFHGRVYGISLIYSGDFKMTAEVDQCDQTRLQIGLNPETFSWKLKQGESFETPEALLTYSDNGLNGMSGNFHRACRSHLGKCADRKLHHPVILNSWEAMYFDFNEEKMLQFIRDCCGLGIDTVVMDDGWFGHRDKDDSSLGDWFIYDRKLPGGLTKIIDACHENNMNFGIWFEPEMISEDSVLYREHPDYCVHTPDRKPIEGRKQLILDMSRTEVVDCIYEQMAKILGTYNISYVKWDMNRHMTDNGSAWLSGIRQGEFGHRYILGVYNLIARLEKNFPSVFFEGCSGGGGRFDFGILYYMPQIWTSDDSDAMERLKIQYGTSFVYPPFAMVAHISECPNHQTGRTTPFATRGAVAKSCSFGYEFDVGKLSEEEKNAIQAQINNHHQMEDLVNDGSFYRLRSPFESEFCAWQVVSAAQSCAYVMFAFRCVNPQPKVQYLRLQGLREDAKYYIPQLDAVLSGKTLMHMGIPVQQPKEDYAVCQFDLIEKK